MAATRWTCGIRRLPVKMADGTTPTAVVWLDEDGVVGIEVCESGDVTNEQLAKSYRVATSEPMNGRPPGRPKKVAVENAALARRLGPLVAGAQIEIRPTPEIDAFVEAMTEAFEAPGADDLALYLEMPEPWRAELSRLATELAVAEPWEVVPPEPPLELRIASLGVTDGRLAVMGHNGETYGLMIFFQSADLATFEEVAGAASRSQERGDRGLPRCVSVNMASLPMPPRGEHEDVALVTVFEALERRVPSETEMTLAVAATRALSVFVTREAPRLARPFEWMRGIESTLEVDAGGQSVSVGLRAGVIARSELEAAITQADDLAHEQSRRRHTRTVRERPSARAKGKPVRKRTTDGKASTTAKTAKTPATVTTPTRSQTSRTAKPGATASAALAYTNRMGDTYYLHEGRTKHGKARYFFARQIREGARAALPDGHEVSESINGVVSIRRADPSRATIAAADVAIVDAERARHPHLRYHKVYGERDAIVVYAPDRDAATVGQYALLPISEARRDEWMRSSRYAPVFRFVPAEGGGYSAQRMTYRGQGGWSWGLDHGALGSLARKFVSKIGTDAFFDLM